MNRRPKILVLVLSGAALGAVAWWATSPNPAAPARQASSRGPATTSIARPGDSRDAIVAKFADSLKDIRQIEAEVKERNRAYEEQRRKFKEDGWTFVETPPPDPNLLALDPSLLGEREEELQVQIHSTNWSGESLERLYEIAVKTELQRTRYVAIEALGRAAEARAQEMLIELYDSTDRAEDRGLIVGYLRPESVEDRVGQFLAERVNDGTASREERRQAAFPLVVAAAIAGDEEIERLVAAVDQRHREEIRSMIRLVKEGAAVAAHSHGKGE